MPGRLRCTVALHYVDGTPIEVFVEHVNGRVEISDSSETFRQPPQLAVHRLATFYVTIPPSWSRRYHIDIDDVPTVVKNALDQAPGAGTCLYHTRIRSAR